jgi:LysR family nitrogen assimilation transcriptional regulator
LALHRNDSDRALREQGPSPPGLQQLFRLVQVAKHGGIARAAAALGTSTASLTRSIAALESEFQAKLLVHHGQGMALTPAGVRLMDHSVEILSRVQRAQADARHIAANPTTTTVLGMPPTAAAMLANAVALRFLQTLPNAKLKFSDGFSGHIREWLAAGRIDVGLLYSTSGVLGEKLWQEELHLIGHADLLAGMAGKCRLRDLADLPLILPSPQHGLRQLLNRHTRSQGLNLRASVEVDSLATIVELIQMKSGATILPAAALNRHVLARLRVVRLVEPHILRTIVLASSTNKPVSQATRTLIDIIHREAESVRRTITETGRTLADRA